jgi:GT2 family glycosyltransferase
MVADLPSLSVSIVCYSPAFLLLEKVLDCLCASVDHAKKQGCLGRVELWLVDNGPGFCHAEKLQTLLAEGEVGNAFYRAEVKTGHGNVGYGAGHNLAIETSQLQYHLVLNPDVLLAEDSLAAALQFMIAHPEAGLLAPAVVNGEGNRQYLCKRYPTVLDLFLRGFAPSFLRRLFQKRLDHYEMRDLIGNEVVWDVPIISGCFMLFRRSVLRQIGGFSSAYFLYFEDFDISLRTAQVARIAYVPTVRITHFGGQAARKGWRHITMFSRSVMIFFKQHGWKWF